ncbi:MAG: hypothetical protein H5T86_04375, partial [Armatimonadetes bacterium]|nr:hypothetical protein [Armatimonadota bacterium]
MNARNVRLMLLFGLAAVSAPLALCYEPPANRGDLLRCMPRNLWDRSHVRWVDDVVVVLQPFCYDPAQKEKLVAEFSPDLLDWYCGSQMNSGRFMWMRGVRSSYCEEYEYQEALQFSNEDAAQLFMDNGIARKLDGTPARFGPQAYNNAYFMCHNAPKWHEVVVQGLTRVACYGDSVTQDN